MQQSTSSSSHPASRRVSVRTGWSCLHTWRLPACGEHDELTQCSLMIEECSASMLRRPPYMSACHVSAPEAITMQTDEAMAPEICCSCDAGSRVDRAAQQLTGTTLLPVGSAVQHGGCSQMHDAISSSEDNLADDHDQATSSRYQFGPTQPAAAATHISKSSRALQHLPVLVQAEQHQGTGIWQVPQTSMLFSAAAVLLHGRQQASHLAHSCPEQMQHITSWDAEQEAELQLAAQQAWGGRGKAATKACARGGNERPDEIHVHATIGQLQAPTLQTDQQVLEWCVPARGMQGVNVGHLEGRADTAMQPGGGTMAHCAANAPSSSTEDGPVLQTITGCILPSSNVAAELHHVLATGSHSISLPTECAERCGWVTPPLPMSHQSSADAYRCAGHTAPPGAVHADSFTHYADQYFITDRGAMQLTAAYESGARAVACGTMQQQLEAYGCQDSCDNMTGRTVFIQQASGVLTPCLVVEQKELGQSSRVRLSPAVGLLPSGVKGCCNPHSTAYEARQKQNRAQLAAMLDNGHGITHQLEQFT